MKKALVIAMSAALAATLGGCKSVPEAPQDQALSSAPASQAPLQVEPVAPAQPPVVAAVEPEPVVVAKAPEPVAAPLPAVAPAPKAPVAKNVPSIAQNSSQLDPRMGFVGKLIHSSSGAKQIESGGNAKALELHAKAKNLYAEAQASGDKAEVKRLLDEAVKTMYTAIQSASPESVVAEKKHRDFQNREESIKALMDAHASVSEEKGEQAKHRSLVKQVDTLVAEANNVFKAGKLDKGQNILNQAYVMVKTSIETMRGGDTLIRSLNFASKEEEYHYEVDRNDTHRMLVDVLLEEKREKSAYVAKKVDEFVQKAEVSRKRAEALAAKGDFDEAVKALEESTKELVRAIRSGGVYIPG